METKQEVQEVEPNPSESETTGRPKQDPSTWGCLSDTTPITAEEAIERLVSGQGLNRCHVEELDLSGRVFEGPVAIHHSRIGLLNLEGAVFQDDFSIENSTIETHVHVSARNRKESQHNTEFHGKLSFLKSVCEGPWRCEYAVCHDAVVMLGTFQQGVSFSYCKLHADFTLNDSIFQEKLEVIQSEIHGVGWFCQMTCLGDALFRRSTFFRKMNARQAHFQKDVYFTDVTFHLRAGFNTIQVDGQIEFDRSHFTGEFSSKGSQFNGRVSFRSSRSSLRFHIHNSSFAQQVAFHRMEIEGPIHTTGVTFGGRVVMDHARFHGALHCKGTTFQGALLCRNATLGHEISGVDFSEVMFAREVDFENTTFLQSLDCSRATFGGKASFRKTIIANPDGLINFERAIFQHRVNFERSQFNTRSQWMHSVFHKRTAFNRCIFTQVAVFTETTFHEDTYFIDAQFLGKSFFQGSEFASIDFSGAEFEGAAYFSAERSETPEDTPQSIIFHGPAQFAGTRFLKKALFQFAIFEQEANFKYAYFGEQISFRKTEFQKNALLTGVFCNLELDLRRITVAEELTLKGANINRRVNLADATFSGIRFYNMVTDLIAVTPGQVDGALRGDKRSDRGPEELERTAQEYLLLKKSFAYQGMHEEEDWAYWQFRRMSRTASSRKATKDKNYWQLSKNFLERVFLDYGSSYGTHPLRITLLAFCLIIGFGVFYWCFPGQIVLEGKEIAPGQILTLVQSIYFSTMAFTTMGFGDIHPNFHGWLKGIVALEALVGIITMTLFVGTYARKIIR